MAINTTTKKKNSGATYLGDYASGNFTPNYDYVSGYYKQNAGYQDPSRYGYKNSMYNIPTNAGFGIPMKDGDNAWNIGAMLGGLWGANYNQRGAAKASKEAGDMLQAEYDKVMGIETPQPQQPTKTDQMYDMAQKAGAIPEQQTKLQMPGSESTPKAEDLGKGMGQGNIQMPDYKGEKLSYIDQKYGLTNGQPHDNPEGDKKEGTKAGEAVGTDISNIDVTKLPQGFNSDLLRANIISKLKASGRNEWQIAQAMQGIEPQLLEKQREYNNTSFDNLYQQYDALIKAGRIDDAGIVLDRMKQFSPERAESLIKGYDRKAKYQDAKNQIEDNLKLAKEYGATDEEIADARKRIALSGIGGGKVGRGVLGSYGTGGSRRTTGDVTSYGDGSFGGYTSKQRSDAIATLKAFGYQGGDISSISDPYARKAIGDAMRIIANIPPGQQWEIPGNGNGGGNGTPSVNKPDPYSNWDSISNMYEDVRTGKYGEDYEGIARRYEGKGAYGDTLAKMVRDLGQQRFAEQKEREENNPQNRVAALDSARRAGLYVNDWTGEVSPAGPYDAPTEEQKQVYKQWKEKHGKWA